MYCFFMSVKGVPSRLFGDESQKLSVRSTSSGNGDPVSVISGNRMSSGFSSVSLGPFSTSSVLGLSSSASVGPQGSSEPPQGPQGSSGSPQGSSGPPPGPSGVGFYSGHSLVTPPSDSSRVFGLESFFRFRCFSLRFVRLFRVSSGFLRLFSSPFLGSQGISASPQVLRLRVGGLGVPRVLFLMLSFSPLAILWLPLLPSQLSLLRLLLCKGLVQLRALRVFSSLPSSSARGSLFSPWAVQSSSASAVSNSSQMSQFLSFSGANPSQQVHSSLGPLSSSTAQSGPAFFIISDPQASTSYH